MKKRFYDQPKVKNVKYLAYSVSILAGSNENGEDDDDDL